MPVVPNTPSDISLTKAIVIGKIEEELFIITNHPSSMYGEFQIYIQK